MNIVVDTNILISSLYKPSGISYELMSKLSEIHQLFISDVSITEIFKHQERIIKSTKIAAVDFEKLKSKILQKTETVALSLIPFSISEYSYKLVKGIDENDVAFVATSIFVNGSLWTGDKPLYDGLKKKGLVNIFNSDEIKILIGYE
jgi:predicted nucleic acid-binding protein